MDSDSHPLSEQLYSSAEFLGIENVPEEHQLDLFHTEPSCPLPSFLSRLGLIPFEVGPENYLVDDSYGSFDDGLNDHLDHLTWRLGMEDRGNYNWDYGND